MIQLALQEQANKIFNIFSKNLIVLTAANNKIGFFFFLTLIVIFVIRHIPDNQKC